MKGCTSLSNLDAFISNCPSKGKRNFKNGYVYSQEFQAMLDSFDSEDCAAEANQTSEKKRRLSSEQVKALEKSFDMENKLEPERKLKLAQELGLHPRQVAIWFQNRRARCKTKHLERDYGILKASYDALKLNFDNLEQEKSGLLEELKKLKAELGGENAAGNCHVKEEECIEPVHNIFKQSTSRDNFENANQAGMNMCAQLEDRSSHGDSSGTHQDTQLMPSRIDFSPFLYTEGSSSPSSCSIMNWYDVSDSVVLPSRLYQNQNQNQSIKLEDQSLFLDDLCNLFSVDQAPSLQWYLPTQ